jgi:hypothetical protein
VLLLTVHHIVFDGWSATLLFQELAALYGAFTSGRPSPLAELPLQYADYARWQREWLKGRACWSCSSRTGAAAARAARRC